MSECIVSYSVDVSCVQSLHGSDTATVEKEDYLRTDTLIKSTQCFDVEEMMFDDSEEKRFGEAV